MNESSSDDSDDGVDSEDDGDCCYVALTHRQRTSHDHMIKKYCGRTFKDVEDNTDSTYYEGVVVDVVFKNISKTLCFSF